MIFLEKNKVFLSDKETSILKYKMENFDTFDMPNGNDNHYVRAVLNPNEFTYFINNIKDYLKNELSLKESYKLSSMWINKVDVETNKDDKFHKDKTNLTTVTYLNEDFVGGEFSYINDNNDIINVKPTINLTIISNDKLMHKVLPVSTGVRYSLICFYKVIKKNKQTLI